MKLKKRRMTIWVCEDDETLWEYQKEKLKEKFPKALIEFFLNAGYAARATGSPDFIIMDVGGLSCIGGDAVCVAKANVEGLSELHPGAIFILNSALSTLAKYVYEELKLEFQAVSRWSDGCNMGGDICDLIKEYVDC